MKSNITVIQSPEPKPKHRTWRDLSEGTHFVRFAYAGVEDVGIVHKLYHRYHLGNLSGDKHWLDRAESMGGSFGLPTFVELLDATVTINKHAE